HCGSCGRVMYAQSLQTKMGQRYPNYICSTYHKGRGCGYHVIKQATVLRVVADKIREHLLLGSIEALEKAIAAELSRRRVKIGKSEQDALRRSLSTLDSKIERATERLVTVDESLVPDVERKLLDLRRQRDSILERLEP